MREPAAILGSLTVGYLYTNEFPKPNDGCGIGEKLGWKATESV